MDADADGDADANADAIPDVFGLLMTSHIDTHHFYTTQRHSKPAFPSQDSLIGVDSGVR